MARNWLRAWAQGPGRQSGAWALSAAAVASLPFLDAVRPPCSGSGCAAWDKVFFLPDLMFMPAILAVAIAAGSWIAQKRHAAHRKRYWDNLDADHRADIPPGHLQPPELEEDLERRSALWMSLGAGTALGLLAYFATTPIGRRACDPVRFNRPTGLQVCQGPAQWSDALIAYEVWLFFLVGAVLGLLFLRVAYRLRRPRSSRRARKRSQAA